MFKVFLLIVSFMVQSLVFAGGEIRVDYTYNQKSIYALITGVNGTKQVNVYKIATNNDDKFIKQISVSGGRGEVTVKDLECGDRIYLRVLQADSADHPNDGQHFRTTVSDKIQCNDKLRYAKEPRNDDRVVKYELYESGDFFRIMPDGKKCQITTKVEDFKIASSDDSAALYFEKDGNLSVLLPVKNYYNQCPSKSDEVVSYNIERYTLVKENPAHILAFVLGKNKVFMALVGSNHTLVGLDPSVKEYVNNNCYGQDGKGFSSYLAFAIKSNGTIVKVKENKEVKLDEGYEVETKYGQKYFKTFSNIKEFQDVRKVCQ